MRVLSDSRLSLRRTEYTVLGGSTVFGLLIVLINPLAAALPVTGTLAAVAMLWSVDRLHAFRSVGSPTTQDTAGTTAETGESDPPVTDPATADSTVTGHAAGTSMDTVEVDEEEAQTNKECIPGTLSKEPSGMCSVDGDQSPCGAD